jgi:hypothetical protein
VEILALRQQIMVLERQLGKAKVRFAASDRAFPWRRCCTGCRWTSCTACGCRCARTRYCAGLILRLHTKTACRRGGALALSPADLDPDQCLILLHEKGDTVRPVAAHGFRRRSAY